MIDDQTIAKAYRLLLDREPESNSAIEEKRDLETLDNLMAEMLCSREFMMRNRDWLRTLFGD